MNEGLKVVLGNSFLCTREEADTGRLLFSGLVGSHLGYDTKVENLACMKKTGLGGTGTSDLVPWRRVERNWRDCTQRRKESGRRHGLLC